MSAITSSVFLIGTAGVGAFPRSTTSTGTRGVGCTSSIESPIAVVIVLIVATPEPVSCKAAAVFPFSFALRTKASPSLQASSALVFSFLALEVSPAFSALFAALIKPSACKYLVSASLAVSVALSAISSIPSALATDRASPAFFSRSLACFKSCSAPEKSPVSSAFRAVDFNDVASSIASSANLFKSSTSVLESRTASLLNKAFTSSENPSIFIWYFFIRGIGSP